MKYGVRVFSVFNNGKDDRVESCRNFLDALKRKKYYESDSSVLSVEIVRERV